MFVHGEAVVAALGLGHSLAYTLGAVVLGVVLRRRLGHPIFPHALLRIALIAGVIAMAAWLVHQEIEPTRRVDALVFLAIVGAIAVGLYVAALRIIRRRMQTLPPVLDLADDPDAALDL